VIAEHGVERVTLTAKWQVLGYRMSFEFFWGVDEADSWDSL
jgi:hypothetical protein